MRRDEARRLKERQRNPKHPGSNPRTPPPHREQTLRIGSWRLEPGTGRLDGRAGSRRLEPRLVDLLLLLAERFPDVVPRTEIKDRVWPAAAASDESVTVAIASLRRALGDTAAGARYIETVPRRGYRLLISWRRERAEPRRQGPQLARLASAAALAGTAALAALAGLPAGSGSGAERELPARLDRAEALLERRDGPALDAALAEFQRALALDPASARAWAGLAETWAVSADAGRIPAGDVRDPARAAALRALRLAPSQSRAHAARGSVALLLERDAETAETAYRRSLELAPERGEAHQRYAWLLSARGELERAVHHARIARALAPAGSAGVDLAAILTFAGRYQEALAVADELRAASPEAAAVWAVRARALALTGRPSESAVAYRRVAVLRGATTGLLARYDAAVRRRGLAGVAELWPELAGPGASVSLAALLAIVGERQRALDELEAAARRSDPALLWARVHPAFAALRDDARYRAVLASAATS